MSLVHGRLTKGDENKDGGCSRKREKRDGRINHGRDVVADKNRKRTGEEHPSRCSIFLSFVDFDFLLGFCECSFDRILKDGRKNDR